MATRAWRAACPNCGAPVEFVSAASASAVCSYCRSTLVRDGEALRRIGVVAELFDDHSPLQRGATGRYAGEAFTLVGRLQHAYADGTWNEWHALFDSGRSGWLSEDNGAYVFAFDALLRDAPAPSSLRAGARAVVDGRAWDVASVVQARLLSAEGELPAPPRLDAGFTVVDLRNAQGEVGTLDFGSTPPGWSVGRSVALSELALQGLRDAADGVEKTLGARAFACPSCGAPLAPRLATTQSLTCAQCHAVVDVSQGVGAELAFHAQNNAGPGGLEPQIALGRSGTLALGGPAVAWQVVGYLERCDVPEDGDDETTFWREYLLWHEREGFAFLVDSEEGWSWVRPITGAPQQRGSQAAWKGATYARTAAYAAKVTWVLGEFYWRVRRDERALVADYAGTGSAARKRMSREQTASEVTWSAGETLAADTVAHAFGLPAQALPALVRDAGPTSNVRGVAVALVVLFVVAVLVSSISRCSDDGCDDVRAAFGAQSLEYRQCLDRRAGGSRGWSTGGGSYGGWSSGGGGHK